MNETKKEYEKIFDKFKIKSNQINSIINKQKETIKNHRNYLNIVQGYLSKLRLKMSISQNNNININNDQSKINEFNSIFEKASIMLFQLDDIFLENKDYLIQNIENIIINIQTNLNDLLLDENNFKKRSLEINQNIEIMNVIIKDFEISEN